MTQQTGVDGAMAGYSALINPAIFHHNIVPISDVISNYLHIARQHENEWIDIQRHVEWMLKNHSLSKQHKEELFTCSNIEELRYASMLDFDSPQKPIFGGVLLVPWPNYSSPSPF
jgi:tRNA-dihydrouridine synthase